MTVTTGQTTSCKPKIIVQLKALTVIPYYGFRADSGVRRSLRICVHSANAIMTARVFIVAYGARERFRWSRLNSVFRWFSFRVIVRFFLGFNCLKQTSTSCDFWQASRGNFSLKTDKILTKLLASRLRTPLAKMQSIQDPPALAD